MAASECLISATNHEPEAHGKCKLLLPVKRQVETGQFTKAFRRATPLTVAFLV